MHMLIMIRESITIFPLQYEYYFPSINIFFTNAHIYVSPHTDLDYDKIRDTKNDYGILFKDH